MFKTTGYENGRDMVSEAARIVAGQSRMIGGEHLAPVVNTCAEALTVILEDYDSLQQTARELGRGSHQHREISDRGRALLARLTGDVGEDFDARLHRAGITPDPRD